MTKQLIKLSVILLLSIHSYSNTCLRTRTYVEGLKINVSRQQKKKSCKKNKKPKHVVLILRKTV